MKDASAAQWACLPTKHDGGLFGHVMRMAHDTPAQMAIDEYITPTATAGWQGRPRTTLPTDEPTNHPRQRSTGSRETAPQQARLATFASDRNQWRILSQEIMKAAQAKLTRS